MTAPTSSRPLHGIRVLALSAVLCGPMCTALRADPASITGWGSSGPCADSRVGDAVTSTRGAAARPNC